MILHPNTLLSHAFALSSLGKAHTRIAAEHRQADAGKRTGRGRPITFNSHFKDWLLRASMLSAAADRMVALEVDLARTFGVSWTEIGEAFGISRQAAWERFARKDRWDKAQPVLKAVRADRSNMQREAELAWRKKQLIDQLTSGDYTDNELATLEKALGSKAMRFTQNKHKSDLAKELGVEK